MKFNLSSLRLPNTFALLTVILIIVAGLTWIMPGSHYDTIEMNGRQVLDPSSFAYIEADPQGITDLLMAPIRAFVDAALIIGFVLLIGGVFGVLQKTGAIEGGVRNLARAHQSSPWVRRLTIPIFMVLFSLGGAIFGMAEEVIPFILIFVPLALALEYDTMTGIAIPFIGGAPASQVPSSTPSP